MPAPSVATYSMSRCVTSRTRTPGDRATVTVRSVCKAKTSGTPPLGGSYASGFAWIDLQGVGRIYVRAIVTAKDIVANTLISYDWATSLWDDATLQYYALNGYWPGEEADPMTQEKVVRYLIILPHTGSDIPPADRIDYYILSSPISSSQYIDEFPFDVWYPANAWNGSFTVTAFTHWPAKEKVTIEQITSAGGWTWHSGQPQENIGKLKATFEDVSDLPTVEAEPILTGILTVNGISVPITNPGTITFTEDSGWHLHGGVETWIYHWTGGGLDVFANRLNSQWEPGGIDNITTLYTGSIGTSEGQCYFPTGEHYQGWRTEEDGSHWHGHAQGSEIWLEANRATVIAAPPPELNETTYVDCVWSRLGGSYQFQGTLENMDGSPVSVTPEWKDISPGGAADTWEGNTSPLYTYSGSWGFTVDGSYFSMTDWTPDAPDPDYTGAGIDATWARTGDNAPTEFCLELNNPTAYNLASNDKRTWIRYPRSKALATWALNNNIVIDGFGSGWLGVNCDVAVVGGDLVITNVQANAYVHKININQHWPPHRFALLEVTVEDDV